jgi:hypothetical protein
MEYEGSLEEGMAEQIVFCYFPWIGNKRNGEKIQTIFPAKVINNKEWEERKENGKNKPS